MPSRRTFIAGAASLGATVLGGCLSADTGAVSPGTDATTDWNRPDESIDAAAYAPDAAAPRAAPSERFTVTTATPTDRPVIADETVYLPTTAGLLALDTSDGTERWRYAPTDEGVHWPRSPAVIGDRLYLTTEQGVVALDTSDGSEHWRRLPDARFTAAPAATSNWNALFVGDTDGTVTRLSPDGDIDWQVELFGPVTRLVASRLAGVFVGTEAGTVAALYDGRGLWRRAVPGSVTALAGSNGNDVFVGTFGGGVLRLAGGAHAGRPRWHARDGPTAHRSLVRAGDGVYGTDGAGLTRLDDHSGKTSWELGDNFTAAPAAAGDTIYVGGDGEVAAYKLDGGLGIDDTRLSARRWTHDIGTRTGHHVAVADGAVFVPTQGGDGNDPALIALE